MTPQFALRANAALSFLTGALLAGLPETVGGWLGVDIDGWLRLLGIGLLAHGGALLWAAPRSDVAVWTKLNLALIAPYPFLMILCAVWLIDTGLGRSLVLIDGAAVGLVALGQWAGLRGSSEQSVRRSTSRPAGAGIS